MKRHILPSTSTLLEALHRLNEFSGEAMTLLVVDEEGRLAGTLTDGDIRRALIRGEHTDSPVTSAMHRDFKCLAARNIDVEAIAAFRAMGHRLIPVVTPDGLIDEVIDLHATPSRLPLSAILMAGGMGERLRPLTLATPKPLLEIEGKAIIDYNVEALTAVGIRDITVTTRYLSHMIKAHFSRPVGGVMVRCVEESTPLGTIGAAALIDHRVPGCTLVMNSDLLTSISFEDMYLRHRRENADITIAAIPYTVSVPYAILATEGNRVKSLEEKPTYSYYANAGIYIFSNDLLASLPADRRTDATDLIELAIEQGRKVVYFPINGTWIDVGTPVDFRQAQDLMRHARNLRR